MKTAEKNTTFVEVEYLRMSKNERIQHFLLLSSFITLVITGFALKFPEAFWVRWIGMLFGDAAYEARGIIHRVASVVIVAVSIYHLYYIAFIPRGRQLAKDFWFRKQDITDLKQSLYYLMGKTKVKPLFGRFSYIEKMEYWAVAWGTIIMGLTGMVLWFENTFLKYITTTGMDIATAIHYYEAILASLAIVVWHFYFVFLNPDIFPMNKAWIKGTLSREEMEKEHPLELKKIEAELKAEAEKKAEAERNAEKALKSEEIGKIKEIEVTKPAMREKDEVNKNL